MARTPIVRGLARRQGIVRPRDLASQGISRADLARMTRSGLVRKLGRGLYSASDAELTAHHSLAETAKRVPAGVICLLSALRFHGLTTQNPFEVWVAIGHKAWRPKSVEPPLRLVHMSGPAASAGIETHVIEGVSVRVFSAAKTVADCFRFRNKIGLDVALEALRAYKRSHRGGMEALWRFAEICRVARVMQPYVEATP
jgi:predicted transcriptional regulator of viral defense system